MSAPDSTLAFPLPVRAVNQSVRTAPGGFVRALLRLLGESRPLAGLFAAMLLLAALALAGLAFDPRPITGAPAWLKPLKFALSTALYAPSAAWLLGQLEASPRTVRALTWVTVVTLGVELALIFLQAARGTTSHFNLATPFDQLVFNVMGVAIAVLWAAQIATAVLLFRQGFADPAQAWTLRLSMLLTVLGAAVGWLMVTPTAAQIAGFQHGLAVASGAHTIGGPDGGPGLPLTNWSRLHGDLRAAHFLGLHGLQIVPLFGWLLQRLGRFTAPRRARLVVALAASYFALFALLLVQALRGQSIAAPDALTLAAAGAWLAGTLAAFAVASQGDESEA
jgi:hypothetical protein